MNKKIFIKILSLVALAIITLISKNGSKDFADDFVRIFDGKANQHNLVLTKHAQCRMGCRYITKEEIEDALSNGVVNQRKSNKSARPCPIKAFEKKSLDGPKIRVIAGLCESSTKIITVIDLDNEYNCKCN